MISRRSFLGVLLAAIVAPKVLLTPPAPKPAPKPVIDVFPKDSPIVGYKGCSYYESGVIYMPYIPMIVKRF